MVDNIYVYIAMLFFACVGAFVCSYALTGFIAKKILRKRIVSVKIIGKDGSESVADLDLDPDDIDDSTMIGLLEEVNSCRIRKAKV